ncbi:HYDIN protein, partial [Vireo altiloquus]|nr:HYDIN protein [Vireo altiloquus]
FYSLDFDEQYLAEAQVRRQMAVGTKYPKTFLMPPRTMGEMLPPEVLEDCEAQKKLTAQQTELKARVEAEAEAKDMSQGTPAHQRTVTLYAKPSVKAIGNPLSQAVMHHVGMDPSSERHKAWQHRGIVVIVHGAPRAGKSEIAAALCNYYGAECLSIDAVVKEAIAND